MFNGAQSRRWFCTILLVVSGTSAAPATVRADELYVDPSVSVPVTIATTAALLGSELLKNSLAARECRWCDRAPDGSSDLNAFDHGVRAALRWPDTQAASVASDVVAFAVVPLAAVGMDWLAARDAGAPGNVMTDLLVVAEATASAGLLTQVVKFSTARERPFVHFLPQAQRARTADPYDNNTSFFSGHTAIAFAIATSSGTVADLRGYRLAPLVWLSGLTLATATGYLRIAGDKHYATDVAAAAAAGGLIGWAIPRVFHRRRDVKLGFGAGGAPGLTVTWNAY